MASGASSKLELARHHLDRVLAAWDTPTDWDDLSFHGFYCVEAAVEAAARHFGLRTSRKHWEKQNTALELHKRHGLPDVSGLLRNLNSARKAAGYGDVEAPQLDAEDLATEIEAYVNAVAVILDADDDND